jgi:hypothetical protein
MRFGKVFLSFIFMIPFLVNSQTQFGSFDDIIGKEKDSNPVQTAVPFLTIAPDSRSGAMGDAGVATSPDASSMHWNPAKYAFVKDDFGMSLTFTPWLKNLIDDIFLAYMAGYKRIDKQQVIGVSLVYFSLGDIVFTNIYGEYTGQQHKPREYALDAAYARLFSDKISGSLAFRFIYSNLAGHGTIGDTESRPGISFAADVSSYYRTDITISDNDAELAIGANISNIGTKISYTSETNEFIPINLRLGAALTTKLDAYNAITFTADANKLLVPTTPEYYQINQVLPNGDTVRGGDKIIRYGKDPNVSVPVGMLQSFSDAPGIAKNGKRNVFAEEMQELTYSIGTEYWYNEQFALRAGYYYEHLRKGNRKFYTVGLGLKLNTLGIDFAYLIPRYYNNNPLANTVRFTLLMNLGAPKKR